MNKRYCKYSYFTLELIILLTVLANDCASKFKISTRFLIMPTPKAKIYIADSSYNTCTSIFFPLKDAGANFVRLSKMYMLHASLPL